MGPTGRSRILQVHPTRRCNLQCLHCYSLSGPHEREQLPIDLLRAAITDASAEGYTVASISGGEPLLYPDLRALLDHAHRCGMLTTVTSNGMLLDARRIAMLSGAADLLAISLDGPPESHNVMRASERAFSTMASRLDGVRASGIPFGFIFTLTQYNVHELDWVASFALEQGARLLQIHPLGEVGRARQRLQGASPDGLEASFAYLEAQRIQQMAGERLVVQLDLVSNATLRAHPERAYAADGPEDMAGARMADLVSPLVIEPDGEVVPLQFGFARAYGLGNLNDAPLGELAARWRAGRHASFRRLCRDVFDGLVETGDQPFVNWYEEVMSRSDDVVPLV